MPAALCRTPDNEGEHMKRTHTNGSRRLRGLISIAAALGFFWLACGAPLYQAF